MSGVMRGQDFIEVTCGCTSRRYGDAVGKLRVFASGELEIICDCVPGCQEGKLSPSAFEKHSGREGGRRWKINVWVMVKGMKVPLLKTALLKYHDKASKSAIVRPCHRDEFIHCTKCQKERRFRLRTKEECRVYHEALADQNWKCSDLPDDKTSCDDDEERASRRLRRGCTRSTSCNGCTKCICFGCPICRFSDCSCQACVDYMKNAVM